MRGETEIEPVLYFRTSDALITNRELEILLAIQEHGSQNKAAHALEISVPVLNRRLKRLSEKVGVPLVETNPLRTRLTVQGKQLLELQRRLTSRLDDEQDMIIAATPILEETLRKALPGEALLLISNDEHNVRMFKGGALSLLILDDPEYLLDLTDKVYKDLVGRIIEIGQDTLLHVRRSPQYIRYGFGAQRLGFRYLEANNLEYEIKEVTLDVTRLFDSGLSFFLNKSLFDGYRDRGMITQSMLSDSEMEEILVHSLNAVLPKDVPQEIEVILNNIASKPV